MKRIVINEMRAWRGRLKELGITAQITIVRPPANSKSKLLAVAYNPSTKYDVYLITK